MRPRSDEISARLERYLALTKRALAEVRIRKDAEQLTAHTLLDMAKRYYEDALHFADKRELVTALSAVNYAHAFLDAAALLGLLENDNNELFMVD
ncbi:MAG TPA: DUF357 domain-containing protein [Candidatus Nanoarchaeia archaeon]|nr:DUF357 domain-containing protein [Candidatus Nanoarchaeia archaeon]